jgi:hypothetical protein
MISFMYTEDYDDGPRPSHYEAQDQKAGARTNPTGISVNLEVTEPTTSEQSVSSANDDLATASSMPTDQKGSCNIRVYVLADKYHIDPLKHLAKKKFRDWAQIHWSDNVFPGAVREILETVPEHDPALREIVDELIAQHAECLVLREEFQGLIEDYSNIGTKVMLQILKQKADMSSELEKAKKAISKLTNALEKKEMGIDTMTAINKLGCCKSCRTGFNLKVHLGPDQEVTLKCRRCQFICERQDDPDSTEYRGLFN